MRPEFTRHGYIRTRRELLKTAGGVLAAGLLAPRIARAATFTLVSHAFSFTGSPTVAVNSTGADLLIWGNVYRLDRPPALRTDSLGNLPGAYTMVGPYGTTYNTVVALYFMRGGTFGPNHFVNYADAPGYGVQFLSAWAGSAMAPLDQVSGTTASTATSVSPPTITPAFSNELVVTVYGESWPAPTGITLNSGTILDSHPNVGDGAYGGAIGYIIQTVAAGYSPTWTDTGAPTHTLAALSVSFKSASAAVVSQVRRRVIGGE